jgi:hypothetical protein
MLTPLMRAAFMPLAFGYAALRFRQSGATVDVAQRSARRCAALRSAKICCAAAHARALATLRGVRAFMRGSAAMMQQMPPQNMSGGGCRTPARCPRRYPRPHAACAAVLLRAAACAFTRYAAYYALPAKIARQQSHDAAWRRQIRSGRRPPRTSAQR